MRHAKRFPVLLVLFCLALLAFAVERADSADIASPGGGMTTVKLEDRQARQIKITAGEAELLVTLNDSKAALDLMQMLPLRLSTVERNNFAKGLRLPKALSSSEPRTRAYEIGGLAYWPEGPDLAIFYDDIYEEAIVEVIPLGKIEKGAEIFAGYDGDVVLEAANTTKSQARLRYPPLS